MSLRTDGGLTASLAMPMLKEEFPPYILDLLCIQNKLCQRFNSAELSFVPSQIVRTCKVTGMLVPSVCFGERIRLTPCWVLSPVGSVVWDSTRKLGRNWICWPTQHMCFPLRACYCACARRGREKYVLVE